MRNFIEAILAQLLTVTGVKFVRVWNNQLVLDDQQESYSFDMPALFIEIINPTEIKQLLDGLQLYDPLIVRIHICHWQLDAGDGTMEQNLDVLDFKDLVYDKMDRFEPDGACAFIRGSEEMDYQHRGVYHSIQDYKTNLIDASKQTSTDGTTIEADTVVPVINATYNPPPYLKGK